MARRRRFSLSERDKLVAGLQQPQGKCYRIRIPGFGQPVPVFPSFFKEAVQLRLVEERGDLLGVLTGRARVRVKSFEGGVAAIQFFVAPSRPGPYIKTSWSLIERAHIYFV